MSSWDWRDVLEWNFWRVLGAEEDRDFEAADCELAPTTVAILLGAELRHAPAWRRYSTED